MMYSYLLWILTQKKIILVKMFATQFPGLIYAEVL